MHRPFSECQKSPQLSKCEMMSGAHTKAFSREKVAFAKNEQMTDEGRKKPATQGILTYCANRTLPYQLYANESGLLVLAALLTSAHSVLAKIVKG